MARAKQERPRPQGRPAANHDTGVGGLGLVAVLLVMFQAGGGSSGLDLEGLLERVEAPSPAAPFGSLTPAEAAEGEFVAAVLGTTETYGEEEFEAGGRSYETPRLVLFAGATTSGCGGATAQIGPHYRPNDETIYSDPGSSPSCSPDSGPTEGTSPRRT